MVSVFFLAFGAQNGPKMGEMGGFGLAREFFGIRKSNFLHNWQFLFGMFAVLIFWGARCDPGSGQFQPRDPGGGGGSFFPTSPKCSSL